MALWAQKVSGLSRNGPQALKHVKNQICKLSVTITFTSYENTVSAKAFSLNYGVLVHQVEFDRDK